MMVSPPYPPYPIHRSSPPLPSLLNPVRFCSRSLLTGTLHPSLIDQIPGRQNDRKTPLGELNWIFTAVTDTIAWNMLPRGRELLNEERWLTCIFHFFIYPV